MFRKYKQTWITLAFVAMVAVALVGCGRPDSFATDTSNGPVAAPAPVSVEIAPEPVAQPAPAPVVVAPATIDPAAVVAAHEEVLIGLYEAVLPSVVRIEVEQKLSSAQTRQFRQRPDDGEGFLPRGEGSGFVWSVDGHVVTNHHVIDGADRVTVIFANGSEFEATVLGSDPDSDLAVLKLDMPPKQVSPVVLGDSEKVRVGQLAIAIGSPFGQEFTMTRGIVSALGRLLESGDGGFSNPQAIQTDAPINPGNSGGPLLDRHGHVIGINSQIISRSGSSSGIGFSVPINTAKRVVPELIATGKYEYAYLGVSGLTLRPRHAEAIGLPEGTRGVMVAQVRDGSPAMRAGLRGNRESGDVITAINGSPVADMPDLIAYMVENNRPGDTVTLHLIPDDGRNVEVDVTLSPRPGLASPPSRPS